MATVGEGAPAPRHTNRLIGETSPYLLQHAHNPVDWLPWGPDALARAKLLDRPIFLSIGYAACHWCHVMERESFEDEATAGDLNEWFVPIKVDREERPDLDQVYMAAVQAMTGSGGWPMSVFLTPEGRPFYGGTYFPPAPHHGLPAFRQVLEAVQRAWLEQRAEVEQTGTRLVLALAERSRLSGSHASGGGSGETGGGAPARPALEGEAGRNLLDAAVAGIMASFDTLNGGWGTAPKFPQPMTIEFLLRRAEATGDPRPLKVARRSLDRMAAGGIRDQLGGGFHRYATDAIWLVPHFEQMLYDNAQLALVYLHAWALTGNRAYREVAIGTLDYLIREMTTPDGAFAASQDADTEGVEGATFVWRASAVREILGEDAALFTAAYGVAETGNWEGVTIFSRVRSDDDLAASLGLEPGTVADRLGLARSRLLEIRGTRPQPARDDKALAAWNGMAVAAFAEAGRLIRPVDPAVADRYADAAVRAAEVILGGLLDGDGRLGRSWKDGRSTGRGVLEDHALLAEGLLALYETTGDERWFGVARDLADTILARFGDPDGGFFDTADDHERLVTRPKDLQDNATPSGGASASLVLLRLAAWTGEARYRDAATGAIGAVTAAAVRYPTAFARWLTAIDLLVEGVTEVAIVGGSDEPGTAALVGVVSEAWDPRRVVSVSGDPEGSIVPLLMGRTRLDDRPAAHVCRGFACRLPVSEAAALRVELRTIGGPRE